MNLQTSLQSEMIADPMDAEQTWPTEEEIVKKACRVTVAEPVLSRWIFAIHLNYWLGFLKNLKSLTTAWLNVVLLIFVWYHFANMKLFS